MEANYYKYYKEMNDNNIDLAFKGPFSHEILLSLADTLIESISKENETNKIAKRVFSIFVELTQNIRDYSAETRTFNGKEVGTGLIALKEMPDHFRILSANMIDTSKGEELTEYIEHLNTLDKNELKKAYKEKLAVKSEKESNGGVGFISILRKSGYPLEVVIEDVQGSNAFFVVSTKIDKEND